MSLGWMLRVWESSSTSGNERLVLLALADSANDETGEAWLSVPNIAKKANICDRTAQRCLRRLVEDRELEAVAVSRGGRRSNRYRLILQGQPGTPVPEPGDEADSGVTLSPPEPVEDHSSGDKVSPPAVTDCHPSGDTPVTPAVTPVSPNPLKEPSKKEQTLLFDAPASNVRPIRKTITDKDPRWLAWYQAYPRHEGKIAAFKAYARAVQSGTDPDGLLVAAQAYAQHVAGLERRFIKQPASWLNAGCWDDEYAKAEPVDPTAPLPGETLEQYKARRAAMSQASGQ